MYSLKIDCCEVEEARASKFKTHTCCALNVRFRFVYDIYEEKIDIIIFCVIIYLFLITIIIF